MKVFKLEYTQSLSIGIDEAWTYFSNPLNLAEITPPSLGLKIKGSTSTATTEGMLIQYTVSPLAGIPMDWVSEIKYVRAPYYFVDEQRVGPYNFWYHEHIFNAVGEHETEMTDIVRYALPWGPLGGLLNRWVVEDKLAGIFNFRRYVLQKKFAKTQMPQGAARSSR